MCLVAIISQRLAQCLKHRTYSTNCRNNWVNKWLYGIYGRWSHSDPPVCMIEMVFPKHALERGGEVKPGTGEKKCCNIRRCLEEEWGGVVPGLEVDWDQGLLLCPLGRFIILSQQPKNGHRTLHWSLLHGWDKVGQQRRNRDWRPWDDLLSRYSRLTFSVWFTAACLLALCSRGISGQYLRGAQVQVQASSPGA